MHQITVLGPAEVDRAADVRAAWDQIACGSGQLNAFFSSPAWWDYLQPLPAGDRCAVAIIRAEDGQIVAAVPVRTVQHTLSFSLRGKSLGARRLNCVRVMGCEPLLPPDEALHIELFRALSESFPECDAVLIEAARADSFVSKMLQSTSKFSRKAPVYARYGMTPHFLIDLPATFEQYLQKFKAKGRYNLRRQVRRLAEEHGSLELVRVEHPADVPRFLEDAARVEQHSWQFQSLGSTIKPSQDQCDKLARLAEQGILRSYILRSGGEPRAMVRGFQYADVYYYSWCGFDQRIAELSPGAVLLYLLIEDLCQHRTPRRLTFLWGDDGYKHQFATERVEDMTALILSPQARLPARWAVQAHAGLCRLLARAGMRRDESRPTPVQSGTPSMPAGSNGGG